MDRKALAKDARAGWPQRRGGARRIAARAKLARVLWAADGERRLPNLKALDAALEGLPKEELDWIFEFSPLGPLYVLPTAQWVRALAKTIRELKVRRVLEVAAGDGFLSSALHRIAPELSVQASDSGTWADPRARMNRQERARLQVSDVPGLVPGAHVLRMDALSAVRKLKPDLVIAAWLPPGPLLDQLIRSRVRYVLDVGAAGGVTASQWSWRFNHDFCEGPLEKLARCRLDVRPARELHSRVTLYYGAGHPDHFEERPQPGDWLWQFRPRRR